MKLKAKPAYGQEKKPERDRLQFQKNTIMIILLIGAALSFLRLPLLNVMHQNLSFSASELMFKPEITMKVQALGSGGKAVLSSPVWAIPMALIFMVAALICICTDRNARKIFRWGRIISGVLAAVCVILAFMLLSVDIMNIEIRMGMGVLITILCLLGYIIYAVCQKKTSIFEVNIYLILTLLAVVLVYPYINTLALSFDASGESITAFPKEFTLNNFRYVLVNPKFYNGVLVTVSRTVIGATFSLLCTLIFAYGLSKPHLIGGKIYNRLCVFTMYFSGGLIPTFIVYGKLGLVNNYMVYIIPNLINVFNMILAINYYKGISPALEESAKIDGASDFQILFSIMIPISAPIVAVLGLFNAVSQWNSWYDAYIYMIGRPDLKPLQNVLIDIVNESQLDKFLADLPISIKNELSQSPVGQSIVAAAIILTIGPIILLYPLLQKYFVKGMMLGAVKE